MSYIKLNQINKIYPNGFHAIKDLTMEINQGEMIVVVGPSGCGKSTLLRIIAGLEEITSGDLYINETKINHIASNQRNVAMVFQNAALYSHMTIAQNIAFGTTKKISNEKITEIATLLQIDDLLHLYPRQLSGGQQQRVAMARALISQPKILLMDEPLSHLDPQLQFQTRQVISKIHQQLDTTIIYVTHNQNEALSLGDRIVVLNDGTIQQISTPQQIYQYPNNLFVASFIGKMNILEGKVINQSRIELFPNETIETNTNLEDYSNKTINIGVRPEDILINQELNPQTLYLIELIETLGPDTYLTINYGPYKLISKVNSKIKFHVNQLVSITFTNLHLFDKEAKSRI